MTVYCQHCAKPMSARLARAHEPECEMNPNPTKECQFCEHAIPVAELADHEQTCSMRAGNEPLFALTYPVKPLPYGHVAPDHFLHQFDRYAESKRLEACARHAAHLYNSMKDKDDNYVRMMEWVVEQLREGATTVSIALTLQEAIDNERE